MKSAPDPGRDETGLRKFLNSSTGKITMIGVLVIAILIAVWQVWTNLAPSDAARISRDRTFICAETGKPFECELKVGMRLPVHSPHSGKETGYPAELCYWTKDGKPKSEPTAVLLNSWVGKTGPTFCPDCGRLVVGHNPPPGPDSKPPPTKAEYDARRSGNR
jgi:hypothetical protein